MIKLRSGQRCAVVAGQPANIGAQVTLLAYSKAAGGWLFDEAYPPLIDDDGEEWEHSLEAADGVHVVVAEAELQPLTNTAAQIIRKAA